MEHNNEKRSVKDLIETAEYKELEREVCGLLSAKGLNVKELKIGRALTDGAFEYVFEIKGTM